MSKADPESMQQQGQARPNGGNWFNYALMGVCSGKSTLSY